MVNTAGTEKAQDQDSDTTLIGRKRDADYLTARIARDHPEILSRMKAGEFKSVRAAALIRCRAYVRDGTLDLGVAWVVGLLVACSPFFGPPYKGDCL